MGIPQVKTPKKEMIGLRSHSHVLGKSLRGPVATLLLHLFFIPFSTGAAQRLDTIKGISSFQGHQMAYAVLATKPPLRGNAGMPVILFLHGAGERGSDNSAQLTVGLPRLVRSLDSLRVAHYLIVVPQCPLNEKWVDTDWTLPSHRMKDSLSPVLANALHVLDSVVAATPAVDTNCLYVTGVSMGGFGTWEVVQRYPDRFAAALPICGGGDPHHAGKLLDIPIWAFHGKKDKLVKPFRTTDMVEAIQGKGGKPRATLYENVGHLCWDRVYQDLEVIRWFISQQRHAG